MSASSPYLALSIFGGSALIAAAIVFAVLATNRAEPPPPVAVAAPAAPPAGEPLVAASDIIPGVSLPAVTASVRQRGHENTLKALARLKPQLVATCWEPVRDQPGPASVSLLFNFSFAPDGSVVGWGLGDDEQVNRPDVTTCVRGFPLTDLRIPAPGAPLGVEVPLTLP